jgi:hypothetical protein
VYFKLITFNGIAPILEPRLLKDEVGVTAQNVNLERGNLNALYTNGNHATLNASSITSHYQYKFGGTTYNLEFDDDVDVVPGPIADDAFDRLYWTGQTFPRMASSTQITSGGSGAYPRSSFRLGIEAPPNLGVATPTGPDDGTQIKYSTSYVYTFVSAFGEEGPPSSASTVLTKVDGQSIALSNLSFANTKSDVNYGGTKVTGVTVTTASGSNDITVTTPSAHGFSTSDRIGLDGFSDTGGFTADRINHAYSIVSTPSSTTFTVNLAGTAATSTATSSAASLFHTFVGTKRIYRSNTGSNTTDFQFVAEVAMDVTTYTDSTNNDALGEIIPSTFWIAPPDDDSSTYPNGQMKGLTAIGNGIFAGFSGKRLCFSEPFLPHAWPVAYRITLEDEIVGISMAGNVLFIGTKGTNYIAAGTDPQAMAIQKLEAAEPLLYKRSLVDMGGYCIYSGPDGLIGVENGQVTNLTQALISPDQWKGTYVVQSAGMHEGKYVGQYSAPYQTPQAIIFDISGDVNALTTVDTLLNTGSSTNRGFYTDPETNELYLINKPSSGNCTVESFDDSATDTKRTFVFKSKEFVLPKATSMNFVKVEADSYAGAGVTVKVFGDGTEIFDATITASGSVFSATGSAPTSFSATQIQEPILRLPTGVHKVYQVEVTSANPVHEICIGESIDELRAV